MKKEKQLELVKKYPTLLRDWGGDSAKTCMAWGLAVGDGWYSLLDELFQKLSELDEEIVLGQVKEKLGQLRIYQEFGNYSKKAAKIINEYELKSNYICESCGQPGSMKIEDGWRLVRCEKCFMEKR